MTPIKIKSFFFTTIFLFPSLTIITSFAKIQLLLKKVIGIQMKTYKLKALLLALILPILCQTLVGCQARFGSNNQKNPISKSSFMLNTVITITLYSSDNEELIDQAFELCKEYEDKLSKTIESSEIYQLNNRSSSKDTFTISNKTKDVIEKALYYSDLSEGAFDITIEPVSSLWNFTDETALIPPTTEIENAIQYVDYKNITLNNNEITFLSPNTRLNLGAIAKGYIADELKAFLLEQGVESAIINLGGNIICIGNKPDGTPFKIGVQKPFEDRNETISILNIEDMSVVSSGVYERNFILDGKNYHHLLDTNTGYPLDNELVSVTIISKESIDGDGLSTTCFALGLEKGIDLLDSLDDVYGIFITKDYEIYYSEGAMDFIE